MSSARHTRVSYDNLTIMGEYNRSKINFLLIIFNYDQIARFVFFFFFTFRVVHGFQ